MLDLITDVKTEFVKEKPGKPTPYCNDLLAGAPEPIECLTGVSSFTFNNSRLSSFRFLLPEKLKSKLKCISHEYVASLSTILLTAFNTWIYRYTSQADLVLGYLSDESNTVNNEGIKNPENILSIRTCLSENPSFTALLKQVQKAVDAAINCKEKATELFSKTPSSYKDVSGFCRQAIFAFRNPTTPGNSNNPFPGYREVYNGADDSNLILSIDNIANGFACELEYHSQLFEADTIIRMAGHFIILLNEIVSNPNQRVAQIPILSETERYQLLVEWNKTDAFFPDDKCIHELFEEQVQMNPQAVAAILHPGIINDENISARQLTYTELNKRANQLAHYLQSLGVGPDVLVGVYMKRSLDMVVAFLGILKAGGAYLPLDPGQPKERLDFIFKDSGISILLSQHQLLSKLPALETRIICLDSEWSKIALYNDETPQSLVIPENLAYVIYTSGSTGMPKGTLIIHKGVVNYLSWCIKAYKINGGNGCPVNSSIGFDATVTSFFSPLLAGKKVVLLPENGEIEALVNVLESKNKFSLIKITPAHLEILSNLLTDNNSEEQTNALVIGGDALMAKCLNFWRKHAPATRLINEYGPTETVVGCCIYEVPEGELLREDIPIGRPIANTQIYILDNYMQPVPIGVTGEIFIGGAGLARGYLNRPELTSKRFISNPFSTDKNARLYKTGDMARYLNDGNIIFLGRTDNQVKIRGYRVELTEIEYALQQCECVSQAVVIAKEDKEGCKQLVGYYVPDFAVVKLKERELRYQWVNNWKELYEAEYSRAEADKNIDPEFNIVGWNDSFTGQPIPALQMKAWLDDIVEIIVAEQTENVLEMGCGTGLIYYRLADKVKQYIGYDLSASSIKQIKERVGKKKRNYCDTALFTAPAHEVTLPDGWQTDTILLNSMIQYFPGEEYMNVVIDKCMTIIKGKGRIIIGDVRDNRLLKLFKGRLRIQKSENAVQVEKFKWSLEQDVMKEEELCFSPEYFYRLNNIYPQITHIDIQWKKAAYVNELSLYRYTVVIYVGIEKEQVNPHWLSWGDIAIKDNIFTVNEEIKNVVGLTGVPNPRLWKERLLQEALQDSSFRTVGEIRPALETADPETIQVNDLLQVAESKGYRLKLFIQEDPLKVNMLFELNPTQAFIQQPLIKKIPHLGDVKTNVPLVNHINYLLQKDIKKALHNRLPDYMVPANYYALPYMPLTKNGKVDRLFLNEIEETKAFKTADFKEPSNTEEKILAQIWMELLSVKQVSIHDDFFELGGSSIQAFRMFSAIRKAFGVNLSLGVLHNASSIEKLVKVLKENANVTAWSCLVPIQPVGLKPPIFCVHGGWGHVLFYRDLAKHLGTNQPFYGLQVKGLNGKDRPYYKMEEMAAHYIKEIRSVQPRGPYYLGGYCYGAIVAFEMAQQLLRQGQEIALLANFNGVSPLYLFPANFKNIKSVTPLPTGNTKLSKPGHTGAGTSDCVQNPLPFKVKDQIRPVMRQVKHKLKKYLPKLGKTLSWLGYKVAFRFYLALRKTMPEQILKPYILHALGKSQGRYIPEVYPGEMVIFRSPKLFKESHLGWSQFVSGHIRTIDVPGDHAGRTAILHEPHVQFVADELAKHINGFSV